MLTNSILILGIVNIILALTAIIVNIYNKKMSTTGRILRYLEILIFPVLGPIIVLIEVLSWKLKDEADKEKSKI
jgi:hypothetical protein